MKRFNLISKYTFIFFTFFLLTIIFLSKILDVSNETLFTSGSVLLIFYVLLLLYIYREINLPLKRLYKLSEKLKSGGKSDEESDNYEYKISELNILLEKLEKMKSGAVLNKDIYGIISEINSIAQRTLSELETAKVFKINRNEFMGNVAHELRTPIFAIQLSLETLLDGAINDENVNIDFLNRAFIQTKRLKELVDDLITISKFETGVKMSRRYFGISPVIRKTIDELSSLANRKNININFDVTDTDRIKVFGDEQRLQQVLVNLIDNAIKYTPESGTINISLEQREKEVNVIIEDNGIGIPQSDIKRIFERFYRVDKTRSRDVGGSGLGLSIVKHILEAHSSQIRVSSEQNKGTRFEFSLKS
jgi:two-component system phosphate regulon sensor histidine kinase PhoR